MPTATCTALTETDDFGPPIQPAAAVPAPGRRTIPPALLILASVLLTALAVAITLASLRHGQSHTGAFTYQG